ncbi:MAG: hypothetical protein PHT59_01920 [Candidatus Omnitrophica bacterium]|nr:hypothetical protein [Candidatus Omnitrophota bacterium]
MDKKRKKEYLKPKIVYEKKIEALAAVCNTQWMGPGSTCCMKISCVKRSS